MTDILILEDDISLSNGVKLALTQDDRSFTLCHSIADARRAVAGGSYDLFILDISLPDGSGLELCREIRDSVKSPILFLTANDTELDIVLGLEMGGDDYLTKPFSLAVLRARVNALLRRVKPSSGALIFGGLSLDFEALRFSRDGVPVELSKTEQRLLHLLASNPGQTITRDRLLDYVWEHDGEFVEENALSVTVSRLRSKLGDGCIKTVRGIGYSWAVSV